MNKIETLKAQKSVYNQLKKLNLNDTSKSKKVKGDSKSKPKSKPKANPKSTPEKDKSESKSESKSKSKSKSKYKPEKTVVKKSTKNEGSTIKDEIKPKKPLNKYQIFVQTEIIKPEYSDLPQTKKIEQIAKVWNIKKNEI
jgi:hypothetical protein